MSGSLTSFTKDQPLEDKDKCPRNRSSLRRKELVTSTGLSCDSDNVRKLHELSTRLLQQARQLEATLVERSRQICRLRWELLDKDVNAMRLETELQLGLQSIKPSDEMAAVRRTRYGQKRSWSSSEKMNMKLHHPGNQELKDSMQHNVTAVVDHADNVSRRPSDWPRLDPEHVELSATVQQLKMELLKLTGNYTPNRLD